jgi:transposase
VRRRAQFYYQQLDALRTVRQQVRRELLAERKKHKAWKLLCQIPSIRPIRAAVLLGILQTPHRFRAKRQLWTYGGVGIETSSSADHPVVEGQLQPRVRPAGTLPWLACGQVQPNRWFFRGSIDESTH